MVRGSYGTLDRISSIARQPRRAIMLCFYVIVLLFFIHTWSSPWYETNEHISTVKRNGSPPRTSSPQNMENLVEKQFHLIELLQESLKNKKDGLIEQQKSNDKEQLRMQLEQEMSDQRNKMKKEIQDEKEALNNLKKDLIKMTSSEGNATLSMKPNILYRWEKEKELIPASSVWCYGTNRYERTCRFKNICYYPEQDRFIFHKSNQSVIVNVPESRSGLLELSTLANHSVFYFDYDEVGQYFFKKRKPDIEFVNDLTFIFSRFHVANIMHTIHDDLIGLYFHLREHAPPDDNLMLSRPNDILPFGLKHHLQLADGHEEHSYGYLFKYFSDYPLRFKSDLRRSDKITCFRDAMVGSSKLGNWYQYGFDRPQGPIEDKNVSGKHIRQFSRYLEFRLGITEMKEEPNTIVIFSRTLNRLLLNEKELAASLRLRFNMPVEIIQMESHTIVQQISILKRTKVAIGLHGSILIMGMFLPPGSVLIELYPYAIPSENYTPYRKMANLPGMNLIYQAWENKHEKNSVTFPDRSLYYGGINHLPKDKQDEIINTKTVPTHLCCTDPFWLFRIYQDTIVDISEMEGLIANSLNESRILLERLDEEDKDADVLPSSIGKLECYSSTDTSITIHWTEPWNRGRISYYSIWLHETYRDYNTTETMYTFSGLESNKTYAFWVRPVREQFLGPYTPKTECKTLEKKEPK